MTIGAWVCFGIVSLMIIGTALYIVTDLIYSSKHKKKTIAITACIVMALIGALFFGLHWFYINTATGQRAMVDQRSNLMNGLERTITVYTANGEIIAQYSGKIDIAANDGGYVKFDFEGKRYIYYNCFVESIAEIE